MKSISVTTKAKSQLIDITKEVERYIAEESIDDGVVLAYIPHTTAGITINEGADPSVQEDIQKQLTKVAPCNDGYSHSEGNSDGHIKSSMMGSSVLIPVSGGSLQLGTWQAVFFCEFDGPRSRKCIMASVK